MLPFFWYLWNAGNCSRWSFTATAFFIRSSTAFFLPNIYPIEWIRDHASPIIHCCQYTVCLYTREGTLKVTKDTVATHKISNLAGKQHGCVKVDSTSYFRLFTIRSYAAVTLHSAWEYMNFQQLPASHRLRNPTRLRPGYLRRPLE